MHKKTFWALLFTAFWVVLLRLPFVGILLDTDSSANAFFARQMLRGEILYDNYHPTHHLPGIYYTYVLAFKMFGDNPVAPKLLLILFMIVSAWLIFLMGRIFFNDFTGAVGAFFYIISSSQLYFAGMTAEMEHFANLPLIATMFLCLLLLRKNSPSLKFIWIGVLGAICVLYKVIFIGSLAATGLAILISAWLERNQIDNGKKLFSRIGLIAIGLILPLVLAGKYFASMGLWQRLLLVFKFGFYYVDDTSFIVVFPKPFGFPLFLIAMNNIALLTFGLIGAYRLIRRSIPLRTLANLIDFTLALWLIISLALAGFRGGGFPHYPLIAVPPLALIAAVEISLNYQRWQITSSKKQAMLGAGIMITLIVANFLWRNYDLYSQFIPDKPGQKSVFQTSIENHAALFDYIKSHTKPTDFIYVWSINLQLYYYADRLPPIDILWPFYVTATGPPERIFEVRTKYIVVDDVKIFPRPEWLLSGLKQNYKLETLINGMEIYRRIGS